MLLSNKNTVQASEAKSKYEETSEMGEIISYQIRTLKFMAEWKLLGAWAVTGMQTCRNGAGERDH